VLLIANAGILRVPEMQSNFRIRATKFQTIRSTVNTVCNVGQVSSQ